ncbi:MAG: hypothetical protein ABIO70_36510 [Pseudomonadota bacterium]
MRQMPIAILLLACSMSGCDDPGAWADTCRMAEEQREIIDPDDEACSEITTTCRYEDLEVTEPGCEPSARAALYEEICQAWMLDTQVAVEAGTTCETSSTSD